MTWNINWDTLLQFSDNLAQRKKCRELTYMKQRGTSKLLERVPFKVAETYLYVRWLCFLIMFLTETGLTDFYDFLKVASFSMLSVPKIIEIG